MNITDIDIKKLERNIEKNYSQHGVFNRYVYWSPEKKLYYKIWGLDYFYRQYFEKAYRLGFYTDIATVTDIIEDDNKNILGYITIEGQYPPILDKSKLDNLIERVSANCHIHNMVHIDFVRENIIEYENKYYLIDLEPSIPVDKLESFHTIKEILQFCNYFYRKKIEDLLCNLNTYVIKHGTHPNKDIKYGVAPGRVFLEKEYLPVLEGSVLFVGVNYYTEFYHKLVRNPALFETLDVSESVIEYGSPHTHYVCDIRNFTSQGYLYGHVCFFGIIGHSNSAWEIIIEKDDIIKTVKILDSLVAQGGTLLIGPSLQTLSKEFWDEIYNLPELKKYELLMLRQIDINYIWHGRKK